MHVSLMVAFMAKRQTHMVALDTEWPTKHPILTICSYDKTSLLTTVLDNALNRPRVFLPQELCCSFCLELSFPDSVGDQLHLIFQTSAKMSLPRKGLPRPASNLLFPYPLPCILSTYGAKITVSLYRLLFSPLLLTCMSTPRGAETSVLLMSGSQRLA